MIKFPKSFLWGSATSSYQTEGGNKHSDWWYWEIRNKRERSGPACDFWNRYPEYFEYLKQGGMNCFRLSVEWARIQPQKNRWDAKAFERYREIIRDLRKEGIEPVVTLWHFTLPQWLSKTGGWLNPQALAYFEKYVKKAQKELGHEIRYWITLNEPGVYIFKSYLEADWPPQKGIALFDAIKVREVLVRAHQIAFSILKTKINFVSSAFNLSSDEIKNTWNPVNHLVKYFLENFSDWGFLKRLKNELDFIGINYYFHNIINLPYQVAGDNKKSKDRSDLGWEIYPKGIYLVSKKAFSIAKKPIMITENGIADDTDKKRENFLKEHIRWLHRAFEQGTPIIGYLHWSLVDNFEWALGKKPRFGLLAMDYKKMKFLPRNSFWFYKKLIETYTEKV